MVSVNHRYNEPLMVMVFNSLYEVFAVWVLGNDGSREIVTFIKYVIQTVGGNSLYRKLRITQRRTDQTYSSYAIIRVIRNK